MKQPKQRSYISEEDIQNRAAVMAAELLQVEEERDALREELKVAMKENEDLKNDVDIRNKKIEELRKRCQRAEEGAASAVRAQEALLDQQRADCERALNERDVARREADYLRKRAQEAEERAVQLQEQIKVHEEVVDRIREQNSRFVEEQREAKKQYNLKAMELASTKGDITRLVALLDDFKDRLAAVTKEKNQIVEISNGFARERDAIQADYDARGRVIKKLRKRLHKLKKKLKH